MVLLDEVKIILVAVDLLVDPPLELTNHLAYYFYLFIRVDY